MPTAIRMKRGGRTHKPFYRIVVQDSRIRIQGREIEILGYYHPCARPEPVSEVNVQKTLTWLRKGAQPSDTVKTVLRKLGVMKHFNDGTDPEEEVASITGGVVQDKGFNAPPPPKPEEEVKAAEEAPEGAAPEAEAGEETPETEATAEAADAPADSEEKSE